MTVAPYIDLYIDQGSDFNHIIYMSDDVTNEAINITGFLVTSALRRSHYSENASANLTCTVTDGAEGEITLSMPHETTANLKPGRYVFDVKTRDQDDNISKILEGVVTVLPSVTR